jgi:hypothetical protein
MQEHVAQPADASPTIFREEVGFVSEEQNRDLEIERREIWSEALTEAKKLAVAISDAQKSLSKQDPDFRPIDPQNFSMAQLMKSVDRSKYKYENEDIKGAKGFLRRGFRKLSE